MPFSLMGFYKSTAGTTYTALSNLASDQLFATGGSTTQYIIPSSHTQIIGAYGVGNTLGSGGGLKRFRLDSPFLLKSLGVYPTMETVDDAASIPAAFPSYNDLKVPIASKANDNLGVDVITDGGTAAANYAILAIGSGRPAPSRRAWFSARFTGTTTLTAHAWTAVALTADQALAPGTYVIGGMRAVGASPIAARIIIPGYGYRPGCIGAPLVTNSEIYGDPGPIFRNGNLGDWGSFDSTALPQVEVLANAGDTAEDVILDLAQV